MGWIADIKKSLNDKRYAFYASIDKTPLEHRIEYYGAIITSIFQDHNLDPIWGLALARQESAFRTTSYAVSGGDEKVGGSYGLLMVSSRTSKALGFLGNPTELCFPKIGVLWSAKIISDNLKTYRISELRDVASVYNSGKTYIRAPESTRNVYVPHVLQYAAEFARRK